jgi:hypothetical protein
MRFSKRVRGLILISVLALAAGASAQTNGLPEIPATDASNYINLQVVVTDKVVQVVFRPTIWLLHLNQRYPNSPLNCVVRDHFTNNFPGFGDYLGRRVEVTGRITDHGDRLEMVLTDTNQIKIINATEINPEPAPLAAGPQIKAALPALPATALAPATPPPTTAGDNSVRALGWILGSLAVIIVLLAFGLFLFWRRTDQVRATRPAGALAKLLDDPAADSAFAQEWKQRALVAEAMAGKQGQMLREKIMPELTEFAKQSLVQGLYAQRNALLETQQKAQQALMELESRLTALQLPLHERIRAYETRIAELEREVETQGQEVRELTRATLALVRKKLEDERERERTQSRFN